MPTSNQIYLVTFMCLTVDTSFIFTKKSNVAKCFFDICNAEMAQWCQKLDVILVIKLFLNWSYQKMHFTKYVVLNWYFSMKFFFRKIRTFFDIENWLWMSKFHDFWRHCAISALQISKNHFATFDFFVKMKLVSTLRHINVTK